MNVMKLLMLDNVGYYSGGFQEEEDWLKVIILNHFTKMAQVLWLPSVIVRGHLEIKKKTTPTFRLRSWNQQDLGLLTWCDWFCLRREFSSSVAILYLTSAHVHTELL